jgi:hypothetical protein
MGGKRRDRAKEGKAEVVAESLSEGKKTFLDLIDSFRYTGPSSSSSSRSMARDFEGESGAIGTSAAPFKRSAPAPEAKKSSNKADAVFVSTSLDTCLAVVVSPDDTVASLKRIFANEHFLCFPQLGQIVVEAFLVIFPLSILKGISAFCN